MAFTDVCTVTLLGQLHETMGSLWPNSKRMTCIDQMLKADPAGANNLHCKTVSISRISKLCLIQNTRASSKCSNITCISTCIYSALRDLVSLSPTSFASPFNDKNSEPGSQSAGKNHIVKLRFVANDAVHQSKLVDFATYRTFKLKELSINIQCTVTLETVVAAV